MEGTEGVQRDKVVGMGLSVGRKGVEVGVHLRWREELKLPELLPACG